MLNVYIPKKRIPQLTVGIAQFLILVLKEICDTCLLTTKNYYVTLEVFLL